LLDMDIFRHNLAALIIVPLDHILITMPNSTGPAPSMTGRRKLVHRPAATAATKETVTAAATAVETVTATVAATVGVVAVTAIRLSSRPAPPAHEKKRPRPAVAIGAQRAWWLQGLVAAGPGGCRAWWLQGLVAAGSCGGPGLTVCARMCGRRVRDAKCVVVASSASWHAWCGSNMPTGRLPGAAQRSRAGAACEADLAELNKARVRSSACDQSARERTRSNSQPFGDETRPAMCVLPCVCECVCLPWSHGEWTREGGGRVGG